MAMTMIMIGLGMLIVPLIGLLKLRNIKRMGIQLHAIVIENKKLIHTNRIVKGKAISYRPVLKYLLNGTEYIQEGNIATPEITYGIGQRVEIYCQPNNPKKIALVETEYIRNYLFFFLLGSLLLIIGLLLKF